MSTSPELPKELPGDEPDDVLFNSIYGLRSIELNRPKKLNSLNGSMARKILPRLKVSWLAVLLKKGLALSNVGYIGMGKVSPREHHPHLGSWKQGALRWR
jgi:3-hydroxyisobutyryl-CoA hydrolase